MPENRSTVIAYSSMINANYDAEFKNEECFLRCKKLVFMHYLQLLTFREICIFCYDQIVLSQWVCIILGCVLVKYGSMV